MSSGILYVVSTPIGNLSDLSLRAIETLKECDYVLAESKPSAAKLLTHYKIQTNVQTYRDENKNKIIPKVIEHLNQGAKVALISDGGTPTISDPGFKLIDTILDLGLQVVSIPGPSAVISALSISGLPTDKFTFVGFIAKKGGARTNTIKEFGQLDATMVIYESPHRLKKTLEDIREILGNRYICISKELTKIHEKVYRGSVDELLNNFTTINLKGEFVLLVAKKGYKNG